MTVNTYRLVDTLSDLCTKDDVISPGMSGNGACHLFQSWRVKYGQRFSYAGAMGAMGTGIPGSIGACLGSGRRRTICINGDGGFQLNIQELEDVRRMQLPIKYFVLNNGGYGAIMNTQRMYFDSRYVGSTEPELTLPPLDRIAHVYDFKYLLIKEDADCYAICKQALGDSLPCLVEVMVSDKQETVMRVGRKIVDGVPVSMEFGEV
jgi:acetolactate synthase-1/2/3 large subunit